MHGGENEEGGEVGAAAAAKGEWSEMEVKEGFVFGKKDGVSKENINIFKNR